ANASFTSTVTGIYVTKTAGQTDSTGWSIWGGKIHAKRILSGSTGFFVRMATADSSLGYSTTVNAATELANAVPIANGGTNNGSLSVTAGTMYVGDGTKLVG